MGLLKIKVLKGANVGKKVGYVMVFNDLKEISLGFVGARKNNR